MKLTETEVILIVAGLQCAAAESWEHGHDEQAAAFRAIVAKLEGKDVTVC